MPHALRIVCPNERCKAMIALMERGTFQPLRARIVRPLSRMVSYRRKT